MEDESLEQIVSAIERAWIFAGAKDFEDALRTVKKLSGFFNGAIQPLETRADFKVALAATPVPDPVELGKALLLMQQLPAVIRHCVTCAAEELASEYPPLPAGRPPAIPAGKCSEVLDFIVGLNRRGYSLPHAKDLAAQRYGVSRTSINRLWARRKDFVDGAAPVKATMAEALHYLRVGE